MAVLDTEEALLQAIERDPDDDRPYLVYADFLQGRGDPRGELIAVQHALRTIRDPVIAHTLRQIQDRLLRDTPQDPLGDLAARTHGQVIPSGWRLGFLEAALVAGGPGLAPSDEMLEALLAAPPARFVRDLIVIDPAGTAQVLEVLCRTGAWKAARSLSLDSGNAPLGDLGRLHPALSRLVRLRLSGSRADLGQVGLRQIRNLELDIGAGCALDALRNSPMLPQLETLVVAGELSTSNEEDLRAHAAKFRHLRSLILRDASYDFFMVLRDAGLAVQFR